MDVKSFPVVRINQHLSANSYAQTSPCEKARSFPKSMICPARCDRIQRSCWTSTTSHNVATSREAQFTVSRIRERHARIVHKIEDGMQILRSRIVKPHTLASLLRSSQNTFRVDYRVMFDIEKEKSSNSSNFITL